NRSRPTSPRGSGSQPTSSSPRLTRSSPRPRLTGKPLIYRELALLAAGVGGGIAGTMASVASVVSYPVLLALGLPPLAANVTNTMSLVCCVPGAMLGARPELAGQRPRILRLGAITAAGGALGAAVLLLAAPGAVALAGPGPDT